MNLPTYVLHSTVYAHDFFSTKVVSLHRASNTEAKKHKNLLGEPLLKKLHDETQKKVSPDLNFFWLIF